MVTQYQLRRQQRESTRRLISNDPSVASSTPMAVPVPATYQELRSAGKSISSKEKELGAIQEKIQNVERKREQRAKEKKADASTYRLDELNSLKERYDQAAQSYGEFINRLGPQAAEARKAAPKNYRTDLINSDKYKDVPPPNPVASIYDPGRTTRTETKDASGKVIKVEYKIAPRGPTGTYVRPNVIKTPQSEFIVKRNAVETYTATSGQYAGEGVVVYGVNKEVPKNAGEFLRQIQSGPSRLEPVALPRQSTTILGVVKNGSVDIGKSSLALVGVGIDGKQTKEYINKVPLPWFNGQLRNGESSKVDSPLLGDRGGNDNQVLSQEEKNFRSLQRAEDRAERIAKEQEAYRNNPRTQSFIKKTELIGSILTGGTRVEGVFSGKPTIRRTPQEERGLLLGGSQILATSVLQIPLLAPESYFAVKKAINQEEFQLVGSRNVGESILRVSAPSFLSLQQEYISVPGGIVNVKKGVREESRRSLKAVESGPLSLLPGGTPINQEGTATAGALFLTGLVKSRTVREPTVVKVGDVKRFTSTGQLVSAKGNQYLGQFGEGTATARIIQGNKVMRQPVKVSFATTGGSASSATGGIKASVVSFTELKLPKKFGGERVTLTSQASSVLLSEIKGRPFQLLVTPGRKPQIVLFKKAIATVQEPGYLTEVRGLQNIRVRSDTGRVTSRKVSATRTDTIQSNPPGVFVKPGVVLFPEKGMVTSFDTITLSAPKNLAFRVPKRRVVRSILDEGRKEFMLPELYNEVSFGPDNFLGSFSIGKRGQLSMLSSPEVAPIVGVVKPTGKIKNVGFPTLERYPGFEAVVESGSKGSVFPFGVRSGPLVSSDTVLIPALKKRPTNSLRSIPKLLPATVPSVVPVMVPRSIPKSLPRSLPRLLPATIPKTIPDVVPQTIPQTVARTVPKTIPRLLPRTTTGRKPPVPPFGGSVVNPVGQLGKGELVSAFRALIKEKGGFREIGSGLTREQALSVGSQAALGSLAATFRVEETGQLVRKRSTSEPRGLGEYFREYRIRKGKRVGTPGTYIQKRGKRLVTRAEVSQLQAARRKSVKLEAKRRWL